MSGKTTLLEHVASLFGLPEKDLLSVQVDEQTDSKVGSMPVLLSRNVLINPN